ncbi:MAG: hypothetical protein NW224_12085 [Leptolyngbyaceae cyanobacterium bins.302]|nr:hypothetical protein [Leptolyngbyaceae cyanobacterium bins.302]
MVAIFLKLRSYWYRPSQEHTNSTNPDFLDKGTAKSIDSPAIGTDTGTNHPINTKVLGLSPHLVVGKLAMLDQFFAAKFLLWVLLQVGNDLRSGLVPLLRVLVLRDHA